MRPGASRRSSTPPLIPHLGAFTRIFTSGSPEQLAEAFVEHRLRQVQLNLSSVQHSTIPDAVELVTLDLAELVAPFTARDLVVWGISATYNSAHPDEERRAAMTHRVAHFIAALGATGAVAATLCTGTRDPDNMWRVHPDNSSTEAWDALLRSLSELLPAAKAAGVLLAVEPEPGNVVAGTAEAHRLLRHLGVDAEGVGFILDPANLVNAHDAADHAKVLEGAFTELGERTICVHAKDTVPWSQTLSGQGVVDYELVGTLYRALPTRVPLIIQDATPAQVPAVAHMMRSVLDDSSSA